MITLQTIGVYSILLFFMCTWAQKSYLYKNDRYYYACILLFTLIMGIRYGVGTDFFSYLYKYEGYTQYGELVGNSNELGFVYLIRILSKLHMPSPVFFGIIALLQVLFLTLAMKHEKEKLPYVYFVFIAGAFFLSYANIMRQAISISLWILSIRYIESKRPFVHYILILMAISFHFSAIILFIAYPILAKKQDWFNSIPKQILGLIVSLVLMRLNIIDEFINRMAFLSNYIGYSWYFENQYAALMNADISIGLGFTITLAQNIIIICTSSKAKRFFDSKFFSMCYSLFYIGVLGKYIFTNSMLMSRFVNYFYFLSIIVGGYILYYLYVTKNKSFYYLSSFLILTLVAYISKGENTFDSYVFIWQDEYIHIKNSLLLNR